MNTIQLCSRRVKKYFPNCPDEKLQNFSEQWVDNKTYVYVDKDTLLKEIEALVYTRMSLEISDQEVLRSNANLLSDFLESLSTVCDNIELWNNYNLLKEFLYDLLMSK